MKRISITAISVCLMLLFCACSTVDASSTGQVSINEHIIEMKDFEIQSESTELNTAAQGTVFVREQADGTLAAKIVATSVIDPADWGGVAFHVDKRWNITAISSSYPSDYVAIWHTTDDKYFFDSMIEIGHNRSGEPSIGGQGTLLIELQQKEAKAWPEALKLSISIGSDDRDGIKVSGPDSITLLIPLSKKN